MTHTAGTTIRGEMRSIADLDVTTRGAMFKLRDAHFENVDRETFAADLADKSHALLLWDGERLVGFSTLAAYASHDTADRPINVVCSGDTIVDPSAWHSAALPREWIAAVNRIRDGWPDGNPWHWLLITSGFRTYRLLSTFWSDFVPSVSSPGTPQQKQTLDRLATDRFGHRYDAATGLVRFDRPQRLREHLRDVPSERMSDPHVAHFLLLNPGHAMGDELATLCSLDSSNLTRAGRRVVLGPPAGER